MPIFTTSIIIFHMSNFVKINKAPSLPGVYLFCDSKRRIIYIGKAKNLKKRIASHFKSDGLLEGSKFLSKIKKIKWLKTNSEIEALILESNLIKKYQPIFNVKLRDDKNYFYAAITNGQFPRVFLTHQPMSENRTSPTHLLPLPWRGRSKEGVYIGPFTDGAAIKTVLFWLRKKFPYCTCKKSHNGYCLNYHIKRCLGFCCNKNLSRKITKKQINEYKRNIKELKLILTGKRDTILRRLKNQMKKESDKRNFEKAAELRDKIMALEKIFRHSLLIRQQSSLYPRGSVSVPTQYAGTPISVNPRRIEAYDISNIQGTSATGSMITLIRADEDADKSGKFMPDKNYYRRFKIKTIKSANDTAMIKEVLSRRLKHKEWPLPDLVVIDGGKAQLNAAIDAFKKSNYLSLITNHSLLIISLAKRNEMVYTQNYKLPIPINKFSEPLKNAILAARDEAHRFAIKYHRKLRERHLFSK